MSSGETMLQNGRPERPGEFTFTWSIHNFSYCTMEENDFFRSPEFEVQFLGNYKWWLELYPRGDSAAGFVSFYLRGLRLNRGAPTFNIKLWIRKSNEQFQEGSEHIFDGYAPYKGLSKFISLVELKNSDRYLVNDTLTLRCRMWKTDVDIPASVKWEAHSRIKVSKLDYTWIIKDISVSNQAFENEFSKSSKIPEFFTKETKICLQALKIGSLCGGDIHFGIEMVKPKENYFWIAVVHLIDTNGSVAHSARGEHQFEGSNETLVWKFPLIPMEKLYLNKLLYLPENQLTLRCELGFATDNKLETFEYRTTNERDLESSTTSLQSDLHRVWIKNMHQCYEDRKFSDFIIRTPVRQFPVSRTILSAHSKVFDAMFERDMKERKTGMVDIEDLDDDIVSKMLKYVYTSSFDANDYSTAQKLYFAADKYGITALQKMCSKYLMGCLDASNVCEILDLADTHRDEELKSCARDFFRAHAKEIISSESWKKLKETNYSLTIETVEWMICIS